MNLYRMMNGVNPATGLFLPMLGKAPNEYPRFRDCFLQDPDHPEYDDHIHIYTRTGGGNRVDYEEENQAMRDMPGFVADFDDKSDCTYASWVFEVPERWEKDFVALKKLDVAAVSPEYVKVVRSMFPRFADAFF